MISSNITQNLLDDVRKMMATGKSLTQVCAHLGMSRKKFNTLLTSNKEQPEMQQALRDTLELGDTLHEAHFEELYVKGMSGELEGVKEGMFKAYMQNKFKWADKTETKTKTDTISELSDDELEEAIKNA
jgi:protein-disulfide isomerase-like protein with CxxC motif